MKRIIFILVFLSVTGAIGQNYFPKGHIDVPMTTTQMNAIPNPTEGYTISNSTTKTKWYYNGTEWVDTGSGSVEIVNNLTSTDTDKALSAAQGKVLQDGKLNLSGGTMTGNLSVPNNTISGREVIFKNSGGSNLMSILSVGTTYGDFEIYDMSYPILSSLNYTQSDKTWRIGNSPLITAANAASNGVGGTDDQTAAEVPFTPYSTIASTNVQDAIEELLDESSGGGTPADGSITLAKMADANANSFIGNNTGSSATPIYLTTTQARAMLNVEDGADATDATNVDAAGAVMNSDTSTASMGFVVDDDGLTGNSDTKVPTEQAVKAYVDNEIALVSPTGINWEAASTKTLGAADAGKIFKNTGSTDYTYTIDTEASATYGENIAFTFIPYSTGKIYVQGETGVVISEREISTIEKPATLIRDGVDTWRWMGTSTPWSPSSFPLDEAYFVASYWAEDLGADASAVSSWPDRLGSSDASQGTGANQPVVDVEGDGKKSVKFDGVNDGLSIAEVSGLDFAPGDAFSLVLVTGEASWGTDAMILFKGNDSSSSTGLEYGFYTASPADYLKGNTYGALNATSQAKTASGVDVWIITCDGTNSELFKNGSSVATWTAGSANISSNIWIGNRLGTAKFFSGSIRAVGIANAELTQTQITNISGYDW